MGQRFIEYVSHVSCASALIIILSQVPASCITHPWYIEVEADLLSHQATWYIRAGFPLYISITQYHSRTTIYNPYSIDFVVEVKYTGNVSPPATKYYVQFVDVIKLKFEALRT